MTTTITPPHHSPPDRPRTPASLPAPVGRARHDVLRRVLGRTIWSIVLLTLAMAVAGFGQAMGLAAIPAVLLATALGLAVRHLSGGRAGRLVGLAVVAILLVGLSATAWSYSTYLTAPGAATTAARTGDWMRDHGMNSIVDRLEQQLYGGSGPRNGRVANNQLPTSRSDRSADPVGLVATPHPVIDLLDGTLTGEGTWTPSTRVADGRPVDYTTFLRPDPDHTNVVAAAVWLDPTTTHLTYVPGTKQGSGWAWNSGIPTNQRPKLVAAFNAGFKFKDFPGGFMTEGQTPVPLVDGQASLVIHADGTADIGSWGTQVSMAPDVVSVRQNLRLIVDGAHVVPGEHASSTHDWGKARWQLQYTNRSGIGMTADHALVYVSGSNLTTATLASALERAGAVRAMELDIHASNPTFNFFSPMPGTKDEVTGARLVPSMRSSADRFLAPDQRDFFAVSISGSSSK